MKTPDEIKKALEIAANGCMTCDCCFTDCPYELECHPMNEDTNVDMPKQIAADAIAYIQQLEAAQPKWISVDERIPEDNVDVIVYIASKKENVDSVIAITQYTHRMYGYNIEGWCSPWQYCFWDREVTHWMPLPSMPEPPKE